MPIGTGVLLKMNPIQGSKTAFRYGERKAFYQVLLLFLFFLQHLSSRLMVSETAAVNITILPCGYYIKVSVHPVQTPTLSLTAAFPKR